MISGQMIAMPPDDLAEFEAWARDMGRPFHWIDDDGEQYSYAAGCAWGEGRKALRAAAIALLIEPRTAGTDSEAAAPPPGPPHTAASWPEAWPESRREPPTPTELVAEWHRPTAPHRD